MVPVVRTSRRASSEKLFALRVRGESMRDAGLLPDDMVIVRVQPTANPGDIVVALVGDEATVKTFKTRRGKIVLKPANDDMDELVYDPGDVVIYGKVVTVLRKL